MPPHQSRIAPLVERLVAEPDSARRTRALLSVALEVGRAAAVELWREGSRGWTRRASSGERHSLPSAGEVAAVAAGTCEGPLPGGRAVLVAGERPRRSAIALAGIVPGADEEERLDLLEALLFANELLAGGTPVVEQDHVLPPFRGHAIDGERDGVHGVSPEPLAGELRELLRRIRRAHGRGRWTESLQRACERAGDAWIDASARRGKAGGATLARLLAGLHAEGDQWLGDPAGGLARAPLAGPPRELARRVRALVLAARGELGGPVAVGWRRAARRGRDGISLEVRAAGGHGRCLRLWLPLLGGGPADAG